MIHRIDHTTITASDLERSVAFYTGHLGFSVDHEMWIPEDRLRIVFVRLGDTILEIFGVQATRGRMMSEDNAVVGYKHICLLVDDVDEEYRRLTAAGINFRITPCTVQTERIAFLKDPDGLDIELIQHLAETPL